MAAQRWTARGAWPALAVLPPFALAAWLGLGPGPLAAATAALVVLGLALRRAGRGEAVRFGRRPDGATRAVLALPRVFGWGVAGGVAAGLFAAGWAVAGGALPPVRAERADAVYELDARIATQPLPACQPRAASSRTLLDRGAHPRLSPEGDMIWFDAAAGDGRRQVHRLERSSGAVVCWTCDEAGNNERPSAGEGRRAVVFETDRFVSWREPVNREIQLANGRGDAPSMPSIRLTIDPAADRAPVLGPEGGLLVWSRQESGRQELVGAGIRGGHGGILLGAPTPVARGGLAALMPLAWSTDARSVIFVRGNPLGTAAAFRLDPATGVETPIGDGAVGAPAGTSGDGGWLALATSEPRGFVARLPGWLGFLIAPLATVLHAGEPALDGTGVRVGEPLVTGAALALGELATWGAPTGVTLDPSGTSLVLGQRRETSAGIEERLVEVMLACALPQAAAPSRP